VGSNGEAMKKQLGARGKEGQGKREVVGTHLAYRHHR